jgi:hypothetical protein
LAANALGKLAGILVVLVALTGCDRVEYVYVTNATDESIALFEFDRNPRYQQRLEPGQTARNTWMYPIDRGDLRRARVEADDSRGNRIYCHDFSYEELIERNWKIRVVRGQIDCAPGSTPPPALP